MSELYDIQYFKNYYNQKNYCPEQIRELLLQYFDISYSEACNAANSTGLVNILFVSMPEEFAQTIATKLDALGAWTSYATHGYFDDEYFNPPKKYRLKASATRTSIGNYFESDDVSTIDGMDGHTFEVFCAGLLKNNGFIDVKVTPGSGDQGVDILAKKDGIKYAIQCKNYSSILGNSSVQEVNSGKAFYNCHVGVVMTNSTFSSGAKALAEATGILLWDRGILKELMG